MNCKRIKLTGVIILAVKNYILLEKYIFHQMMKALNINSNVMILITSAMYPKSLCYKKIILDKRKNLPFKNMRTHLYFYLFLLYILNFIDLQQTQYINMSCCFSWYRVITNISSIIWFSCSPIHCLHDKIFTEKYRSKHFSLYLQGPRLSDYPLRILQDIWQNT